MRPFIAIMLAAAGVGLLIAGVNGNAQQLFETIFDRRTGPVTPPANAASSTATQHVDRVSGQALKSSVGQNTLRVGTGVGPL